MSKQLNRQWIYTSAPEGKLTTDIFELRKIDVPEPGPGEVLVHNQYFNIMPGNRAYMHDNPIHGGNGLQVGNPMMSTAVGEVVSSNDPAFAPGDVVQAMAPWQDYVALPAQGLAKRDGTQSVEHYIGLMGQSGYTAYVGLLHVGRPVAGETLLVSAAAGGIGTAVVQLGKIAGCRVVGVAGGPEKCAWLEEEVGADATVDYKAGNLAEQLQQACPEGVDLFFDNTGGPVLEAALDAMKIGGRIVLCGNTAQYDTDKPMTGPAGVPLTLILKDLTMKGFAGMTYAKHFGEADRNYSTWLEEGRIKPFYHVIEGLEQAPNALVGVLNGANRGMTMVRT
ncbi:NADP-dependent oxidoreductase [Streptomyces sp. NPDC051954]|uniref:NADP-dependent oxidoreductase n=1 Tax=unclassified Streptomyces TaxID=2593676 RepID=UPI003449700A